MRKHKVIISYLVFAGMLGLGFFAVSKSQSIIDWWNLRNYQPSALIEALAYSTSMNNEGRKLFYVHDPALLKKDTFSDKCTVGEETIVLGCYISRRNIYLFDVEDERLNGVEEVTAAHEMLHAAFDRLSLKEKEYITELIESAYSKLDNPRIIKTIASYEKRDKSTVINELHSILGTEVKDLPKALEDHYSRYFDDRQKVVALSEQYAEEFEKREAQIDAFDKQIAELQGDIARYEADISQQAQALTQERILIEGLSGNPEAYNQAVDAYNSKVVKYNRSIDALKSLINEYNKVVTERNKIALEEKELVEAIDTRATEL
jgi:hypothetical protein